MCLEHSLYISDRTNNDLKREKKKSEINFIYYPNIYSHFILVNISFMKY